RIFLNGVDTGKVTPALIDNIYRGSHTIYLTLDNPAMSKTELVVVERGQTTSVNIELLAETRYRALLVGIDKYKEPGVMNLIAPPYDVDRIEQVFERAHFGDRKVSFSVLNTLVGAQATRSNIFEGITSTFSQAGNDDVSYFYYSGHGWVKDGKSTILPHDAKNFDDSKDITVEELAEALGSIPGTKIVIMDACYSGGFIGKELYSWGIAGSEGLQEFNANVIDTFASYDLFGLESVKGNLATQGFQVIVSATGNQQCFETINPHPLDGNPYGYFSRFLCEGCGYNSFNFPYPADQNRNRKVTINEIYQYICTEISHTHVKQDAQVYPLNSSFTFIEY
ncbi:MAG TPA: caspase family protein, partial [Atribacterota bacterium]|nr:caspase family protein [Atribacterota bacterium]